MKMNSKKTIMALAFIALMTVSSGNVNAQSKQQTTGWGASRFARPQSANFNRQPVEIASAPRDQDDSSGNLSIQAEDDKSPVGTWVVDVSAGDESFAAFHTFGADGTFVETSSGLATLSEGPAHGVWSGKKKDYLLTFEVFEFAPDQSYAGRVRVRCAIHLDDADHLTALYTVDFIDLDGTMITDVGGGNFRGVRLRVVPR
jgi:hypothetical protein